MNVFITGINGFIGSYLARYLHENGVEVSGCSRSGRVKPELAAFVGNYYTARLAEEFSPGMFVGVDAVVHGAHSFDGADNIRRNVEGTEAWFHAARAAGVATQVFLTSYSAKPGSGSEYAEIKFQLERFFVAHSQPVLRPGFVLGDGGLFGRMMAMIKRLPVMPLLDGGRYRVPIVSIHTLAEATLQALRQPEPEIFNVFQRELVPLVDILRVIRQSARTTCWFVPVPSVLPLAVLKTLEFLHIPFPVKSASITALKENQALDIPSSLARMGLTELSLQEMVRLALAR